MKELKVIGTGVLNTSEIERLKEFPKEINKASESFYIDIV